MGMLHPPAQPLHLVVASPLLSQILLLVPVLRLTKVVVHFATVDFATPAPPVAQQTTQLPSAPVQPALRPSDQCESRSGSAVRESRVLPVAGPLTVHTPYTPINIAALEAELSNHPDSDFVSTLITGLHNGFHIGYDGPRTSLLSPNLSSAYELPHIVSEYLAKECACGHMAGPYDELPCEPFRTAGIGLVPKKSGGHRLIVHLSAPEGSSINDGISNDQFSLQYITVDHVVAHVIRHGRGALMFKVDIRHAFRLIPVHPEDWPLLGMSWQGRYYIDKVLPFGLRSSPAIFNRFAEALCWVLRTNYSMHSLEHYLDDFIGVAPPCSSVSLSTAAIQKATLLQVFENLGVPVALGDDKVIGPTTAMTVLGIEVDSVNQVTRLPDQKLSALLSLLSEWSERTSCTKRELLSFIGTLSFAAKVIPPGRTFIRRLLDLSCSVQSLQATISIDSEAHQDIIWWQEFAAHWNGKSIFHALEWTKSPDLQLFTDASGVGYGAYFQGLWFWGQWPADFLVDDPFSIMTREMIPIALACAVWGENWQGKRLLFHCDNESVVKAWYKGTCRNKRVMSLIRFMLARAATCNFIILIRHIAGTDNSIADALSRAQVQRFRELAPSASPRPVPAPPLSSLF